MRNTIIILITFALNGLISGCNKKEEKPLNVVFFLVDDLGWRDVGCNGSSFYETPHIDRFAEEGVRFTNAYAACHVCSPTRASILTGKYPASINLTDWLPGRQDFAFQKMKNVKINQHLPYGISTLPKVLKERGYHTAIFGKWHLGEDSASVERQGFDLHLPKWNKGWPNKGYFFPYGLEGLEGGPDGEYLTDRLTDEALNYLEKHKDQPFFLYLSHFAVHDPIEGRPDLVKKYSEKLKHVQTNKGMPYILEGNPDAEHSMSRPELTDLLNNDLFDGYKIFPHQTVKIKQYQDNVEFAGMVESMDESFGRVLQKLQDLKIDDHTVVIFYSDNGGMSAANFYYPDREIPDDELNEAFATSNLPLRAGKGWLYEGGIRVPLIIKWPKPGLQNLVCDVPVTSPDFYPTILELLKIQVPDDYNPDGESLVPLLKGEENLNRKAVYWHFPHYSNHGMQSPGGAIRLGDYKLLEYFENNTVQLFNLRDDLAEQHDLSISEPEKVNELRQMLHEWREKVGARMMDVNPDYRELN
jgi:arylsulfatase A